MLRKHRTAVVPKRNLLGKLVRGRLSLKEVLAMELLGYSKDDFLNMLDSGLLLPAVGGAPANQNTVLANPIYFPRAIVVSTDQTVLQGDMVWWDDVHYTLKQLTNPNQVAYNAGQGLGGYCGVAQGTNVPGVYPNPPAGTPSENLPGVIVQRGGTVRVNGTTGDGTYFPFEPVTVGADQQTISRGAETSANRVGLVIVPPPVTARSGPGATPLPETAAGSGTVELWILPAFPTTSVLL